MAHCVLNGTRERLGREPELWALFVTLAGIPPQEVCRPIMHQDQGSLKEDRSQPIGSHSPRQPLIMQTVTVHGQDSSLSL